MKRFEILLITILIFTGACGMGLGKIRIAGIIGRTFQPASKTVNGLKIDATLKINDKILGANAYGKVRVTHLIE